MSSTVKEDAILDLIVTYRERSSMEVSIEFADWLADNKWKQSEEGTGNWINMETFIHRTTDDLYNWFYKQKIA
jgi:hypothetical protein